jgi:hypothetical protein
MQYIHFGYWLLDIHILQTFGFQYFAFMQNSKTSFRCVYPNYYYRITIFFAISKKNLQNVGHTRLLNYPLYPK